MLGRTELAPGRAEEDPWNNVEFAKIQEPDKKSKTGTADTRTKANRGEASGATSKSAPDGWPGPNGPIARLLAPAGRV